MLPKPDVIDGFCGCGACVATYCPKRRRHIWMFTTDIYVQDGETLAEEISIEVWRCPYPRCRYDLGRDGKARRTVGWTVEKLRARIAQIQRAVARLMTRYGAYEATSRGLRMTAAATMLQNRVRELRRLVHQRS